MVRVSLHAVTTTRRFMFGEHSRKPTICNACLVPTVTQERFCDGLGSNIMVQYSVGSIITTHSYSTAREYMDKSGNRVHPMIQTLFPNDAAFQDDNAPIHTAATLQPWFENHEGELQHLPWPA
jgi:hypothetical protein